MSLIKLNKALKLANQKKSFVKKIPTHATLSAVDGLIELEINGIPSIISIEYEGTGTFTNLMELFFKVIINKNKIIINNLFRKQIPQYILSYSGNIFIRNCIIIGTDGSRLTIDVNNNQNLDLIDKSKTNLEDDDLIIYDEGKTRAPRFSKTGLIKPKIKSSSLNAMGKIQKYGKKEVEDISSIISDLAPGLIRKGKPGRRITGRRISAPTKAVRKKAPVKGRGKY